LERTRQATETLLQEEARKRMYLEQQIQILEQQTQLLQLSLEEEQKANGNYNGCSVTVFHARCTELQERTTELSQRLNKIQEEAETQHRAKDFIESQLRQEKATRILLCSKHQKERARLTEENEALKQQIQGLKNLIAHLTKQNTITIQNTIEELFNSSSSSIQQKDPDLDDELLL
jgi:hypothetical protein